MTATRGQSVCLETLDQLVPACDAAHRLVLLDGLVIGKCDRCGHRYYPAAVVKMAERAAKDPGQAARIETVPVVAA